MAFPSKLFNEKRRAPQTVIIDGFEIDASLSEEHSFESEVTEHPVESGADIADHVRARPISVTIDGIVSDTPIGGLSSRHTSLGFNPSNDAFAKLLEIRDRREPVTIETALRVYDDMVLVSLNTPRDSKTGDALRFRATFTQIQIVTNERTSLITAVPNATNKVNRGSKPAHEVPAVPKPAYQSKAPQAGPLERQVNEASKVQAINKKTEEKVQRLEVARRGLEGGRSASGKQF